MSDLTATLRVLAPSPGVFAYYDGRIADRRLHKEAPNWLDDGAFELGVAAYSIVDGDEALIFDSHISLEHATAMRAHVESLGVRTIRLVLSHAHDDHVAGNAVFADCDIIAHRLTAARLERNRDRLENGDPPIRPLVLPNRIFDDEMPLRVGRREAVLAHFDIHAADSVVLLLSDLGLLLAGDVVEDCATYIAEPERTEIHISELARLAKLPIARILPAHGAPEIIADGGYAPSLIDATARYLGRLIETARREDAPAGGLAAFIADDVAAGRLVYYPAYEAVHARNLARIRAVFAPSAPAEQSLPRPGTDSA